jgi:signal transduction histidine kinase/CheY-like chemotaxis protein
VSLSTVIDAVFAGSGDVSVQRVSAAAVAGPWWRRVAGRVARAISSDWLPAVLIVGVLLNLGWADPWHARQAWVPEVVAPASAPVSTGNGWSRWLHIGFDFALTSATVTSALAMLLQRRALMASRRVETCCEPGTSTPAVSQYEPAESVRQAAQDAAGSEAAHAERLRALGQLAAGVAHDFNNVLTAVQGGASLIGEHADDPAATRRFTGIVLEATARGRSVTGRLLGFARREEIRPEPLDPRAVLDAMQEMASHTMGQLISVRLAAAIPLRHLMADRGQLETALLNFAINARDAMPSGGTLTFSAAEDFVADAAGDMLAKAAGNMPAKAAAHPAGLLPGTYIRISVGDTGSGMDRSVLERALEPFFTTKPAGQGTGLGLPMAKAFAERSGGGLAIDSSPGCGTTVSLWLPAADADDAAPDVGRKHILLVEDDPLVSETLAEVLTDSGYGVTALQSGAEAATVLRSAVPVDALIADLSVNDPGGLALIEQAQLCRPGLPCILLTAGPDHDAALAMQGALSGTFSLLRKPVGAVYLVARIDALLAAART